MPEIVELPATVVASAGGQQQSIDANNSLVFAEIFIKVIRMAKVAKKDTKKEYKFPIFSPTHFSQFSSYRTIGSPMFASPIVEVRQLC
jgi:hypothetical protein